MVSGSKRTGLDDLAFRYAQCVLYYCLLMVKSMNTLFSADLCDFLSNDTVCKYWYLSYAFGIEDDLGGLYASSLWYLFLSKYINLFCENIFNYKWIKIITFYKLLIYYIKFERRDFIISIIFNFVCKQWIL